MSITQPQIIEIIATLIAFFFAITFHEFSHALASYLLGDDTAKKAGRLSLNPLVHIDPIGLLFLFLFRIGWAKPVPMNVQHFRYPRLFAILSAFAGPISNFLLALISLYFLKYLPFDSMPFSVAQFFSSLFSLSAQLNVMLGVFNFLPIPPLDGGHLLLSLIPDKWRPYAYRLLPFSAIALLLLLMLPQTQYFLLSSMDMTLRFLHRLVI